MIRVYYPDYALAREVCDPEIDALLNSTRKEPVDYRVQLGYDAHPRSIAHGLTQYRVDLPSRWCSCPHHQYRGVECKHIRALRLLMTRFIVARCPDCYGDGYDEQMEECARCNGRGYTLETPPQEVSPAGAR